MASGTVVTTGVLPTKRGLRVFRAVLKDDSGLLECAWPGQPFLERQIKKGLVLLVTGPVRYYHGRQLIPREFMILGDAAEDAPAQGRILSVYPATEGLTNRQIAERLVVSEHTVHRHVTNILRKLDLPSRTAAAVHAVRAGLLEAPGA